MVEPDQDPDPAAEGEGEGEGEQVGDPGGLVAALLLVAAAVVGLVRLAVGLAPTPQGTWINLVWVVYDLVVLSVIIQAARYTGYRPSRAQRTGRPGEPEGAS